MKELPNLVSGAARSTLLKVFEDIDSLEDDCDYRKFADWMRDIVSQKLLEKRGFEMVHPLVMGRFHVDIIGDEWVATTYNDLEDPQKLACGVYLGESDRELTEKVYFTIGRLLR